MAILALPVAVHAQAVSGSAQFGGDWVGPLVFTGADPAFQEMPAPIEGQRVIVQINAYFHQMDLAPHRTQPIGLVEYFNVEKGTHDYQAEMCEKWTTKVHDDEADWTEGQTVFPYLEIDIAKHAKPFMLNGVQVYRARDVLCWEAMDFGPPLY
ncbi:MAG: hypothetical protein ACREHV_14880 [Rhizomicrobium sp.]